MALFGAMQLHAQDLSKLIPSDAVAVLSLNAKSYSSKVDMDKVMELDFFKKFDEQVSKEMGESYDLISLIYKDPKAAGVELKPKSYMYVQWLDTLFMGAYICHIADKKKFEDFVNNLPMKGEATVQKAKGYKYLTQMGGSIAWTNSVAMISYVDGESRNLYKGLDYDDENYYDKLEARREAFEKSKEAVLIERQNALVNVTNSVNSNANFVAFNTSKYDAGVWLNTSNFGELIQKMQNSSPMLSSQAQMLESMGDIWKDSYYHLLLSFDDGEINMTQNSYTNERMFELYKGIYNKEINPKMFDYVNANNMLGFGLVGFDIKKLAEATLEVYIPVMEQLPQFGGGKARSMFDLLGIALDEDDLANVLSGVMMMAVTDFKEIDIDYIDYEYDDDYNLQKIEKTRKETVPIVIAELGIGNKEHFMMIMKALQNYQIIKEEDGVYSPAIPNAIDVKMIIKNDMLIVTNDPELLNGGFENGIKKKDRLAPTMLAEVLKYNQYFYMNIPKIMAVSMDANKYMSDSEKEIMTLFQEKAESVKLMGVEIGDKKFTYRFKATMTDKKENSAMQLFKILNELYLKNMESESSDDEPVEIEMIEEEEPEDKN